MGVVDGMPADGALKPGDQILAINDQPVESSQDILDLISSYQKGIKFKLISLGTTKKEPYPLI
ncbi:PDZ domain-containing protein [Piscibacillus salipiscarius]|uniref:PDZ domain-containing protein n=1 Tax=Piscibacillus salipiscarius TaxID=299480 RepID=UPI0034E1BBAE